MTNINEIYKKLRKKNRGQYFLLAGTVFLSIILVNALLLIVNSKTVLTILPEGGDSRKQITAIFALSAVGSIVFVNYSIGLFLKYKSKETGVLLALGGSRRFIKKQMLKEVINIILIGSILGLILGTPLAWGIWQLFKIFIVNTKETVLNFSINSYIYSIIFLTIIVLMALVKVFIFMKNTNIMDTLNTSRKSETINKVPNSYGLLGIGMIIIAAFLILVLPSIIADRFDRYIPDIFNLVFYIILLMGIYMVMLHTVVNGWRKNSNRYKGIVSRSMMKFEGRQTVKNMVIICLLIIAGYIGIQYCLVLIAGNDSLVNTTKIDYAFRYREDQDMVMEKDIYELAEKENIEIRDYKTISMVTLGVNGEEIIDGKNSIERIDKDLYRSNIFISESSYNKITGENISVKQGELKDVYNIESLGENSFWDVETNRITNTETGEFINVKTSDDILENNILKGYKVINDEDYKQLALGLNEKLQEKLVAFNVDDLENSYNFANSLYNEIIDHSNEEVELTEDWDYVEKKFALEKGEIYVQDNEFLETVGYEISYDDRDSAEFKSSWKYRPQFKILDKVDFIKEMAVYFLTFTFAALISFVSVMVISYTRSITIALNNKYVFDDLKKLGAKNIFLRKTIKEQMSKIFTTPIAIGTLLSYLLIITMFLINDGRITSNEANALISIATIILLISMVFYIIYRYTFRKLCNILNISTK